MTLGRHHSASICTYFELVLEELEVRPVDLVELRQLVVRELGKVLDPALRGERSPMPEKHRVMVQIASYSRSCLQFSESSSGVPAILPTAWLPRQAEELSKNSLQNLI